LATAALGAAAFLAAGFLAAGFLAPFATMVAMELLLRTREEELRAGVES
jgi:hypothetical protein